MNRFDPSAHANYLTTLLAIGIALERLVPEPGTAALTRIVALVRGLEAWFRSRIPPLRSRPKLFTELTILAAAIVVRAVAFVVVHAFVSP
ncbi:MAG: hypothetical protein U0610_31005 [bacterium]